jgi:CheY-like chemotaxis protein
MRHNPCCLSVPVVVLTSSHQEGDVSRAYAEYANAYLVKPNKPDELLTMVKALRDFWLIHNYAPGPFKPLAMSSD